MRTCIKKFDLLYNKINSFYKIMSTGYYVLEVLEFLTEKEGENGWLAKGGKYKHIGYMNNKFKTKKVAEEYYNNHNPHMRPLNAHNNYRSDWDPKTKLLYIVRKDYMIIASIHCFPNSVGTD